jgi:predicted RNA-binding Zn-ribbon protein involved in translation (DUF1610 family)
MGHIKQYINVFVWNKNNKYICLFSIDYPKQTVYNKDIPNKYFCFINKEEIRMIKKAYQNTASGDLTTKAHEALTWYRNGHDIVITTIDAEGWETTRRIKGAAQKKYDKNQKHVRSIRKDLENYIDGLVYKCPDCGETIVVPDDWSGECYKCPNCGTVSTERELDPQTIWDYFEGCYDIEYTVGSDKKYRAVRVMVACGGPNIYVNTKSGCIELYWWNESAKCDMGCDLIEEIDNYFEELYEC